MRYLFHRPDSDWQFVPFALQSGWPDEFLVQHASVWNLLEPIPKHDTQRQAAVRSLLAWLGCEDVASSLRGAPDEAGYLHVLSNQYWLPLLALNPHLADTTTRLFRPLHSNEVAADVDGAPFATALEIFGPLARYLLHLTPQLRSEVLAFRQRAFPADAFVVGVHVRTELLGEHGVGVFVACTRAAVLNAARAEGAGGRRVVVFVASDSQQTKETVQRILGDWVRLLYCDVLCALYLCFVEGSLSSFIHYCCVQAVSYAAPIERFALQGQQAALIDMFLLTECDALVLSAGSTFGYPPPDICCLTCRFALSLRYCCCRRALCFVGTAGRLACCCCVLCVPTCEFRYMAAGMTRVRPYVVTFQSTCLQEITTEPCVRCPTDVVLVCGCFASVVLQCILCIALC